MNIANTNTCRKTYLGKSINNSVYGSIYYSVRNLVTNSTNIRL